jgi:hypothetical protein
VKRAILTLLIITLTVGHASAQGRRDKPKMNWGAGVGLCLSNAKGSWTDIVGYDRKTDTGFSGSLFGAYNVTNNIAVRSELFFSRKGFVLVGDEHQAAQELTPFAYYMDVPILLEWDFLPYNYVRPHIFAGPSFGYLLTDGIGITIPGKKNAQARDITNFTSTNLSYILGFRLSFPAGRSSDRGYIEIRYTESLDSFIADTNVTTLLINEDATKVTMGGPGEPDAVHQVVMITFGMMLD